MSQGSKNIDDFMQEAELQHHLDAMRTKLRVTNVAQLKYVEEEDLVEIGMTKPEIRRLKKQYDKECPKGAFGKLRRILSARGADDMQSVSGSRPVSQAFPSTTSSRQVIAESAISELKKLGEGQFGTVQQGVWTAEDGRKLPVAVKCLNARDMANGLEEFLREASVMQALHHDNILRLYGVVLDSTLSPMLVTELAPLRSLLECMKDEEQRKFLTVPRLCDFAQQICAGMTYLESQRFVHRDLAARNVLVASKSLVKISDFGLSRALGVGKDYYQSNSPSGVKLPIAWCAPECMNYLRFTSASDVWAFGVTLWEMFRYGEQPWFGYTAPRILEALAEPLNQRLEQPAACPDDVYKLMATCWHYEPDKRPTFSAIGPILAELKLDQVQVTAESPQLKSVAGCLPLAVGDVITVLNKKPANAPQSGLWLGVTGPGVTGYFSPKLTAPYIDMSTLGRTTKLTRHESARDGVAGRRKLTADMISQPQNDLRHLGHIGYDGAMYGDVAFIGSNYDKLPVKVQSPFKRGDTLRGSTISLPLTDVSTGNGGLYRAYSQDNSLDMDDFSSPGLLDNLDFGSSLMDDIMEALEGNAELSGIMRSASSQQPLSQSTSSAAGGGIRLRDQPASRNGADVTKRDTLVAEDSDDDSSHVTQRKQLPKAPAPPISMKPANDFGRRAPEVKTPAAPVSEVAKKVVFATSTQNGKFDSTSSTRAAVNNGRDVAPAIKQSVVTSSQQQQREEEDSSRRNTLVASDEDEDDDSDAESDKSDDTVNERLLNLSELLSFSRFPNASDISDINKTRSLKPAVNKDSKPTLSASTVDSKRMAEKGRSASVDVPSSQSQQLASERRQSVRTPAGIPGRGDDSTRSGDSDDVNPMRRLRQPPPPVPITKPSMAPPPVPSSKPGQPPKPSTGPPPIPSTKPSNGSQLNANASFFDKLQKEGLVAGTNGSGKYK